LNRDEQDKERMNETALRIMTFINAFGEALALLKSNYFTGSAWSLFFWRKMMSLDALRIG